MTNDWDLAEGKAKQPQIPGLCCAHRCCWAAAALPGASFSTGGEGDDCPEPGRKDVLFLATCFLDWASRPSEHLQEGKRAAIGKVQQPHSPRVTASIPPTRREQIHPHSRANPSVRRKQSCSGPTARTDTQLGAAGHQETLQQQEGALRARVCASAPSRGGIRGTEPPSVRAKNKTS